MQKNIMGLLIVGLMLATTILVGSTVPARHNQDQPAVYESQVLGIGSVRIIVSLYEIKGFVLFGILGDQILLFQNNNLASDGSSIRVDNHLIPHVFDIHDEPKE